MYLPNYTDGSIVNLMSSLLHGMGASSQYQPLPSLSIPEISAAKNVALVILDGVGYDYLVNYPEETFFHKYLHDKLTTVFPSTTAAAIGTFLSGVAPQQHALTGWFMHAKELGAVLIPLRFQARCVESSLSQSGIPAAQFLQGKSVFDQIQRRSYLLHNKSLSESPYYLPYKNVAYESFEDCFRKITYIVRYYLGQKFVYVYWGEFDSRCHEYGVASEQAKTHFRELADQFSALIEALAGTDTLLLITADHGLLDTEPSKIINMDDHPELRETLVLPLCGEPRAAYCYVRPAKVAQFERYIAEHFSGMCDLYRSETLIEQHYFGLFEPNPKLFDRIGDYVLMMRENYIIKDFLINESRKYYLGNHGGLSEQELFVPLIRIRL